MDRSSIISKILSIIIGYKLRRAQSRTSFDRLCQQDLPRLKEQRRLWIQSNLDLNCNYPTLALGYVFNRNWIDAVRNFGRNNDILHHTFLTP